ncbi:hypothetical protein HN51_031308 [Arachis hypogaea]
MTVEILYLYKPRTTSRSDDAPPPLVKRLEALAGSRWRSGSRLVDAAAPSYRSGNLFVVTNLKLDSSSAGIFGHLSDSFLRRKDSLMVVCALNAIFCLTIFFPNYWIYVILCHLTGFSTGGVGLCAFVLATDTIGPKNVASPKCPPSTSTPSALPSSPPLSMSSKLGTSFILRPPSPPFSS